MIEKLQPADLGVGEADATVAKINELVDVVNELHAAVDKLSVSDPVEGAGVTLPLSPRRATLPAGTDDPATGGTP